MQHAPFKHVAECDMHLLTVYNLLSAITPFCNNLFYNFLIVTSVLFILEGIGNLLCAYVIVCPEIMH
jgi:hypothetical protein